MWAVVAALPLASPPSSTTMAARLSTPARVRVWLTTVTSVPARVRRPSSWLNQSRMKLAMGQSLLRSVASSTPSSASVAESADRTLKAPSSSAYESGVTSGRMSAMKRAADSSSVASRMVMIMGKM